MGGDTNITQPAQPTYGEGMEDAMLSQMQQLLGQGKYADIYKEAGFEGGNLGDILTGVEAPIRKATAQIDTDVMRQTLLGDSQAARTITQADVDAGADPASLGKVGVPQSGFTLVKGDGKLTGEALDETEKYEFVQRSLAESGNVAHFDTAWENEAKRLGYPADLGAGRRLPNPAVNQWLAKSSNKLNEYKAEIEDAGGRLEPTQTFITTNAKTGEAFREGEVVRAGEGMVDLMGDSRAVQEQTRSEDYAQYVKDNPDIHAGFVSKRKAGQDITIEEHGKRHYEKHGQAEGRELPMGEYSLQGAGRQAGFGESGEFMGLSALAEDIGRGGQQRAREADIADVERLGGRATDAYRAQGDLSGALAQARAIGAGGIDMESAIPADNLFGTADPLKTLAARTKAENLLIDGITSGGMTYAKADPVGDLTADISYAPSKGVSGGAYGGELGTYDPNATSAYGPSLGVPQPTLRSNLLADAKTSLTGGPTAREERQISEAMKAQSTMMGRTFDQSAGLAEAEARLLEDRNRQALNRQYAQQVLGQEAGLQESDLGRGLQASLANQQATNRAAEYGVGAGLQREQAGAQFDQQTALANQAAKQDAARYTAQEGMQAKQMELGRQTAGVERQLTAEEKDIERIMRQQAMEEQYRQQGLGAERANAAQMVGLEQATSADPFQAILQRQGQNNLAAGGAVFGQAGYGLDSGPQYLNPEAGLGFIQNQATNAANMFNATTEADATRSGGMWSGLGALGGGLLTGGVGTAAGKGLKSLFS